MTIFIIESHELLSNVGILLSGYNLLYNKEILRIYPSYFVEYKSKWVKKTCVLEKNIFRSEKSNENVL